MSWFRRHFGLDVVDVAIQVAMTALTTVGAAQIVRGPGSGLIATGILTVSLGVFAWRRQRALAKLAQTPEGLTSGQMAAVRLEELEQRLAELEGAQARVLELEERLDFTERLLARAVDQGAIAPAARGGSDG